MSNLTLTELKQKKEAKLDALIKKYGMFFAFSNAQFEENKTPLVEGDEYVSFCGGYMPKSNAKAWLKESSAIINEFETAVLNNPVLKKEHILYELENHEAFYVGDIENTLDFLGEGYTEEEVWAVFHERNKQTIYS